MYAIGVLSDKQMIHKKEQERFLTDFDITVHDLEKVKLTSLHGIVLPKNEHVQIEKLFQWLIKVRESTLKPIWILASEPLGEEKLIYLKLGVTGFLVETDSFEEIAWTIKNGLLSMGKEETEADKNHNFCLDPSSFTAVIAGKKMMLTKLEYMLLDYLYTSINTVRTYEEIANYLWKKKESAPKYRVANLIFHIRQKIEIIDKKYANMIKTVRSKGYILTLPEEFIE
ncbi:hypothetical protein A5881_003157 [Enterococcus termitis]|nr:hypothetical protein A5881_003692 [Enterococcus termitis]